MRYIQNFCGYKSELIVFSFEQNALAIQEAVALANVLTTPTLSAN